MKRIDTTICTELGEITVKDLVMSKLGAIFSIEAMGREKIAENGDKSVQAKR